MNFHNLMFLQHLHFRNNNHQHEKFCILIVYMLCLSGKNAPEERVFSLVNKLWMAEKKTVTDSSTEGNVDN